MLYPPYCQNINNNYIQANKALYRHKGVRFAKYSFKGVRDDIELIYAYFAAKQAHI